MKTKHTYLTLFILMALFSTTCIDDRDSIVCPEEREASLTFTLQLPVSTLAAALDDTDENAINDFTIVLFRTNSQGKQEYVDNVTASTLTLVANTSHQYKLEAKVKKGAYYFMFLANTEQLQPFTFDGKEREQIEEELQLTLTGRWDIDDHPGFPMWSMIETEIDLEAYPGGYTHPTTIGMIRMLARINLELAEAVKEDLRITHLRLHNPSGKGRLIPEATNLVIENGAYTAQSPTLPLNAQGQEDPAMFTTPWEYTGTDIDNGIACTNRIYTMESYDPTGRRENEYTWLEVGCTYKGAPEEVYRVDFIRTLPDGTREHRPILRNHSYNIMVLSITGDAELEFEVMEWNDSDMSDIVFEGKYFLRVNQSNFELDRQPHDANGFNNKLTIETNYEDGWVIDRLTEPDDGLPINMDNGWIRIDPAERSGLKDKTIISILLDENNTGASRSAEVHLRVGRLIDFIVTVTQHSNREIELHIEDLEGNPIEELVFYDFYGNDQPYEQKAFRVRWAPYGTDNQGTPFTCEVRTTLVGDDYFDYKAGTERITTGTLTDPTGRKEYIIEPEPFTEEEVSELFGNPFLQHASWVTFTVTDPDDHTKSISKTIFLNHLHIAIISRNFRRLSYLSRKYEFEVLANTPFIIESVDNTEDAFVNGSYTPQGFTGGNNIVRGTTLTYTTQTALPNASYMNGIGQAGHKATFFLRDQRGLIPDRIPFTVSAIYDDPNCYLINPPASGTSTLRIPIRKLFWIREREAGDNTLDDLIESGNWEPGILMEKYYNQTGSINSPVNDYTVTLSKVRAPGGIGALEDMLQVTIPARTGGGVSGNIILGAKRPGSSTWLWTWHIWLTSFNPDTRTSDRLETEDAYFMKRSLGALTDAELLNPNTTGFYYQWGRKDPLHPDHIPNNRQAVEPGTISNLLNAINNPATYYRNSSALGDWYTGMNRREYQNNFLWDDYEDHKTPYDPCPAGWRVPYFLQNSENQSIAYSLWRHTIFNEIIRASGTNQLLGYRRKEKDDSATDYMFTPAGGHYYDGVLTWYGSTVVDPVNVNGVTMFYNANIDPANPTYGLNAGNNRIGTYNENGIVRASALPVRCIKRK